MSRFISLTRVQIKDFLSKYQSSMNVKNNFFSSLLLILAFAALLIPGIGMAAGLFNTFMRVKMPELAITYTYIGAVLMMFFTALPFIISVFFYSKDLKFLASLPIKEATIVFSKLSTVYLYLLVMGLILFAPVLVIYGMKIDFSLSFVIFGLLALLLSPVLPLLISALIILPAMRLVSNSRRKNLFSIIGGLLFFVLIIAIQIFVSRQQLDPNYIQGIMFQENGLIRFFGMRFPPSIWLTGMVTGSLKDAIFFILLNAAFVVAIGYLAKVFYQRAMMNYNEESAISSGKLYYRQRSKGTQLIRRHILIIVKQPTFFLNTLLSLLVPALMFAVMIFTGEASLTAFQDPLLAPFMLFIFAGIITAPAIIANISATAITREGKAFWETKVLPISSSANIKSRVQTTILVNLAGSALMWILAPFILPLTLTDILLGTLLCFSITFFLATVDIIVNIYRPFLNWTNPTAAVKNNMNIMISLAIRAVVGAGIYYVVKNLTEVDITMLAVSLIAVFTVLYLITRHLLYHYFIRQFDKIVS